MSDKIYVEHKWNNNFKCSICGQGLYALPTQWCVVIKRKVRRKKKIKEELK